MQEKFAELRTAVRGEVLERNEEIDTAINAMISRTHHFQIGPPGIAKSLLVERILKRIDANYFRWLLTKHTTPEEVFGPPDLAALRDRGVYKRVVDGKLPWADFVFLDEIYKGSSAILNSLLTAINERLFFNPEEEPFIPLVSIFAASNEWPESEELNALKDRLHFTHEVDNLKQSSSVNQMLTSTMDPEPGMLLRLEDIHTAQAEAAQIPIPEDIIEGLLALKNELNGEGITPTDRRWNESMGIIRAQAWLQGASEVEIEHITPLVHVLWYDTNHKKTVQKAVYGFSSPYDVKALDFLHDLDELRNAVYDLQKEDLELKAGDVASDIYQKHQKVKKQMDKLEIEIGKAGKQSDLLDDCFGLFKSNLNMLMAHMGLDDDDVAESMTED